MGVSSIAKKVVGRTLSIAKKVAIGSAAVAGVVGYGLHTLGSKQLEKEHPKNNPPPLPTLSPVGGYDKKVGKRKAEPPPKQKKAKGIERVGEETILSKDKVAMGMMEGPTQDPYDLAEAEAKKGASAAKKFDKDKKKGGLKSKVGGLFRN